MQILFNDISSIGEGHPFNRAAIHQYQILEKFRNQFIARLTALHCVVSLSGIPSSTNIRDVLNRALTAFRQPPLSAQLPLESPVDILRPQGKGRFYVAHGLPKRQRWVSEGVSDEINEMSLVNFFFRKNEFTYGGVAKDPNGSYILNIGMSFNVSCSLLHASLKPPFL